VPGLVGFTHSDRTADLDALAAMRAMLRHGDYRDEPLFADARVAGTRAHLGLTAPEPQPVRGEGCCVWLEGEFYNNAAVTGSDAALLLARYRRHRTWDCLRDIDGFYTAVIYDSDAREVHLISDRFGLKLLFYHELNGELAWSSETKAFLALPGFEPAIERQSIDDFFTHGQLLTTTWFEGVHLLPPGSVLSFSLTERTTRITPYFSLEAQEPGRDPDRDALLEEVAHRFRHAVETRLDPTRPNRLQLSGGLDSRAILAATPEGTPNLAAFTFGTAGCDDIRIAARCAAQRRIPHHVALLDPERWMRHRLHGVWYCDGHLNLLHMHGLALTDFYRAEPGYLLNGFLGDAVLGGSYLDDPRWGLREKVTLRGRRFINEGTRFLEVFAANRNPFFDNGLMETVLAVPESWRRGSRFYNQMLLRAFPDLFSHIPWQTTGCPISWPDWRVWLSTRARVVARRLDRLGARLGIKPMNRQSYADYAHWLRLEPARSLFRHYLEDEHALYPAYIDRERVVTQLEDHLNGKGAHQVDLGLALTFELWLQAVFNGAFHRHVPWLPPSLRESNSC